MINEKKPQAVSHMIWFFIIPSLVLLGWISFKLIGSAFQEDSHSLKARVEDVRTAKTSAARWQAAYSLAQDLQKMRANGDFDKIPAAERQEFLLSLGSLVQQNTGDDPLKKYFFMMLSQMGEVSHLDMLQSFYADPNEEIRFYATWSTLKILERQPEGATPERLDKIAALLTSSDLSLKKIASVYLAQAAKGRYIPAVEKLLADPDLEVRWNAAAALASVGVKSSVPVLKEAFTLEKLRSLHVKRGKDLEQLLVALAQAARKLGDKDVLASMEKLKAEAPPTTPEGQVITHALNL